jgi:hypothetical protein
MSDDPRTENAPTVAGWLSPYEVLTTYGIPYAALRWEWHKGRIHTRKVRVPRLRSHGSLLTYSLKKDLDDYAERRRRTRELSRASAFLRKALKSGPVKRADLVTHARAEGIAVRTLRRAKDALRICATQRGLQSPCWWHWPEQAGSVPVAAVPPAKRPLQEKALRVVWEALNAGAKRFRDVEAAGAKAGIGRGTLYLAWRDAVRKERRPVTNWEAPSPPDNRQQEIRTGTERKRRGRKAREAKGARYQFCYEQLAAGIKRRTICRRVQERFNRSLNESDVTIYARRYANATGKPWPV